MTLFACMTLFCMTNSALAAAPSQTGTQKPTGTSGMFKDFYLFQTWDQTVAKADATKFIKVYQGSDNTGTLKAKITCSSTLVVGNTYVYAVVDSSTFVSGVTTLTKNV